MLLFLRYIKIWYITFQLSIKEEDLCIQTYGTLYQVLSSTVGDIPIGIYRTKSQKVQPPEVSLCSLQNLLSCAPFKTIYCTGSPVILSQNGGQP